MKRELQNREIYQAYDHMNRQDYFQSSYSIPEHLGTGFIHCYAIPWGIVIGEFFMRYRQDMVFRGRATSGTFEFTFCLGDEIDWTMTGTELKKSAIKLGKRITLSGFGFPGKH